MRLAQVPVVLNDAETLAAQAKLEALKKGFGEESLKAKAAEEAENGTSAPAAAPAPTLKGSSANKVSAHLNMTTAAEEAGSVAPGAHTMERRVGFGVRGCGFCRWRWSGGKSGWTCRWHWQGWRSATTCTSRWVWTVRSHPLRSVRCM